MQFSYVCTPVDSIGFVHQVFRVHDVVRVTEITFSAPFIKGVRDTAIFHEAFCLTIEIVNGWYGFERVINKSFAFESDSKIHLFVTFPVVICCREEK